MTSVAMPTAAAPRATPRASTTRHRGGRAARNARCRAAAEPDWKTKQREQDALISVEEDAVKRRVEELLAPILDVGAGGDPGDAANGAGRPASDLAKKIRDATSVLESGLVERETEVRLLLLAAFCGEHLLLLGPPGTAKSGASRLTLVPIRPRPRGERRSLRTLPGVRLSPPRVPRSQYPPSAPFNSTTDAFQLHPDVRSYGTALRSFGRRSR